MAVYENSRYLHTTLDTRLGGDLSILGIRERFTFNEEKCILYTWVEGDTLDGLATRFYDDPNLRWAILDANVINYNTEFDIKVGDTILIPSYEEILEIVNV